MRKTTFLLTVLMMLCSVCLSASADLITGPSDDDFYDQHEMEINSPMSLYEADREIAIVKYPNSSEIRGVIEKGRIITAEFTYTDETGEMWGMQRLDDGTGAWFSLKHMTYVKGYIDFWYEHYYEKKDITTSNNEIIRFEEEGFLVLWEYPGSDLVAYAPPTEITHRDEYPIKAGSEYIDEDGTRWLDVSIDFRTYIGWLNMSEPVMSEKPAVIERKITLDENFDPTGYEYLLEDSIWERYENEFLIGSLVIAACALTGIFFFISLKRKS